MHRLRRECLPALAGLAPHGSRHAEPARPFIQQVRPVANELYINATVGFDELGTVTHKSPKSLMRMLSPDGNPQARNLFEIVAYLQKNEGLRLTTRTTRHRVKT